MGMTVPRRRRIFLDTMVIGQLDRFQGPREYVQELRGQGAHILVCPGVLKEIGLRRPKHRRRAVASIKAHCTGITKVKSGAIMGAELNNSFKRLPPPPEAPIRSTAELDHIFSGPQTPGKTPFFGPEDHNYFINPALLATIDRAAKGVPRRLFEELGFRRYALRVLPDRVRTFANCFEGPWSPRKFEINDGNLEAILPMWGFMTAVVLSAANEFRAFSKKLGKGEGSLSDFDTVVEAAYGDVLLTRDRELFEAFQVIDAAFPSVRLKVRYMQL